MDYSSSCKELMKQLLLAAIKYKVNPISGFSLLEALVGILVITTFTLTALQAMVIATVFRVKAEQKSGATNWIQERVENAKFEAFQLDIDSEDGDDDTDNGGNEDPSITNPPLETDEDSDPDDDDDGDPDDIEAHPGTCNATSSDSGYAAKLNERLPSGKGTINNTDSPWNDWTKIEDSEYADRDLPGKTIWLLRNATPSNQQPNVLQLKYVAVLDDGGNPSTDPDDIVAELYTEVIPDEAFACN